MHRMAHTQIARSEGIPGLYRGLTPSLAMAVPSTVLYYSLYDSLRDTLHTLGAGPFLAPLVGGSCSRIVAATATAPLELIRTRMQVGDGWMDLWVGGWMEGKTGTPSSSIHMYVPRRPT